MTSTVFTDQTTHIVANWLNDVNTTTYSDANVKHGAFGAVGNGVVDDTAAIQAAIDASYGKRLLFPKGTYRITASLKLLAAGITLVGEQFGNVTIVQDTDNTPHLLIGDGTLGNRVTRATIQNLQFIPRAGAANWTTAYAIECSYVSFINIVNCDIYGLDGATRRIFGGIKLDRVSFSNIYDCWVRGIKGSGVYTVGAVGNLSADIRIMNTYVIDFEENGIHIGDHSNGIFVINQEIVTSVGKNGVYLDSSSSNFFFTNINMELSVTGCDGLSLIRGSLIQVQDGWWGSSADRSAVRIEATATNITFSGVWTSEGKWTVSGSNVSVQGPGTIGSLVPTGTPAFNIAAAAAIVSVKNMSITQFTGGGIVTTGSPADITLVDNDLTLIGGGGAIGGTFGARSEVRDNRGDLVRGTATSITPGASPYTYTAGARPENITITGGTVSAVVSGGWTISAGTNVTVSLLPNKSVTVTYTVAPTMVKMFQ